MSTERPCTEECEEPLKCVRGMIDECVALCPANSNTVAAENTCACYTSATYFKRVDAGNFCVKGYPVKKPYCPDGPAFYPVNPCFCGLFDKSGCGEAYVCHDAACYNLECDTTNLFYGPNCKCGDSYITTNAYCKDGIAYQKCADGALADGCGCGAYPGVICGPGNFICYDFTCKYINVCVNGYEVPQSSFCSCCDSNGKNCASCAGGNKCVDGVCLCRTTESSWHSISQKCTCGSETCARLQHCHENKCYDLIEGVSITFDTEKLCRNSVQSHGLIFNIIEPGKYCTASGYPSDVPMCNPKGSDTNGPCVCSDDTTKQCVIKIDGPAAERRNCARARYQDIEEYKCISMCVPSSYLITKECVCSVNYGVGYVNDLCVTNNDGSTYLHRPCNWSYFSLSGGNACYCNAEKPDICDTYNYCSIETQTCTKPPACAQGIVSAEACSFGGSLCYRGNSFTNKQCVCAIGQPILGVGAGCVCGPESKCGLNYLGKSYFCVENLCLPSCASDGFPEIEACVCQQKGKPVIIDPEYEEIACELSCQDGFYLDAEQRYCVACDSTCGKCTATECLYCTKSSYQLNGKVCIKVNKAWVITVSVIAAVVGVAAIAAIVVVCLRKHRGSQVAKVTVNEMRDTRSGYNADGFE